jgi:hypothetical protein
MVHRLLHAGAVVASGAYLAISFSTILHRHKAENSYRLSVESKLLADSLALRRDDACMWEGSW